MELGATKVSTSAGNPVLRALVKQIADLVASTRDEETRLTSLTWVAPEADLEELDREIDGRWQTIEGLADRLFDTQPHGITDAAAQAAVALALSNAGEWDEDHSLTAAARTLAALGPSRSDDPTLAAATRKLHKALAHL